VEDDVVTLFTRGAGRKERSGARLLTADGVWIGARHDPGPSELGFVVAHGFTLHRGRHDVRAVVAGLLARGGAISFDFRGHGASGGLSTVGDLEVEDLRAAVAWARSLGYRRVVTVGWSLGAGVAVRHAALYRGVDAVVAVSGPSRWHYRGTAPMRLVHRGVETRLGRAVLALGYDTRIDAGSWVHPPEPPDAVAGRIAPVPLLVVHGDADHYFPIEHARWLVEAAGPTARLWVERGLGHAEAAASPALLARIADWAAEAAGWDGGEPASPSARMPA
jgi:pimeloyl-ACP methyl ester carboxylesterase